MINLARSFSVALVALCLSACAPVDADGPIHLQAEYANESIKLTVRNDGDAPLHFSASPLTVLKNPDFDLFYVFSGPQGLRDQCVVIDMVPSGRRVLGVDESVVFEENVTQLSDSFCLDDGQRYDLRIVYGKLDRNGYRVVLRSNKIDFLARKSTTYARRYPMRLSAHGTFFEFEPATQNTHNPADH